MRIHPSMKTLATRPAKLAGSRAARRRGGEQVISPHDILSDVEAAFVRRLFPRKSAAPCPYILTIDPSVGRGVATPIDALPLTPLLYAGR